MIEKKLGHYLILEKIGAGGMGEVYRAHDEELDRDVALKVLPAGSFRDPAARARLLREARSAAALNHPHICTIYEVGEAEGQAYIAMELVEGQPLSTWLADGALPAEHVLRYGLQLAGALAHAHERGVVHRDLKSTNVIVTTEGRAKVLDFGLAKRLSGDELDEATRSQASLTQPGAVMGTLAYMAPEQLRGQPADARSDLWALGVVLYEMAVGLRPFRGDTGYDLSAAILRESPPPLPPKMPVELRAVIERCLEKEPGQRYQRAGEARAALEAIQKGAVAPWAAWRYRLARRPWLVLVGVAAVLVAVLVGLNVGGLRTRLTGSASRPKIESLAVLPLENLSGDSSQDYFADGMTEELITDLAQLGGLKVIARGSVMRYKGTKKPLSEIARELKVDALITGAVLRSGDRLRITAQLVNPETAEQLWTERYERDLRDVLRLQNDLTRAIAGEIRLKLAPEGHKRLAKSYKANPEAYQDYLRGRYWFNKQRGEEVFNKAIEYFQQAIAKDPAYALAYAGLADCYSSLGNAGFVPAREAFPRAKDFAQKALEIDDALAEAHASLGYIKAVYDWDWSGAEREYQRSIDLNPNSAEAHHDYAAALRRIGRLEESIRELKRAAELDPLSGSINLDLGGSLYFARQYDAAIEQERKILELDPNFVLAHYVLGMAYVQKFAYKEGIAEFQEVLVVLPGDVRPLSGLGNAYAVAGRRAEAQNVLDQLNDLSKRKYVPAWFRAVVYVGLGEKDKAFEWLEKSHEERSIGFGSAIKVDPIWDPLRSDPRFADLLRRMNLQP